MEPLAGSRPTKLPALFPFCFVIFNGFKLNFIYSFPPGFWDIYSKKNLPPLCTLCSAPMLLPGHKGNRTYCFSRHRTNLSILASLPYALLAQDALCEWWGQHKLTSRICAHSPVTMSYEQGAWNFGMTSLYYRALATCAVQGKRSYSHWSEEVLPWSPFRSGGFSVSSGAVCVKSKAALQLNPSVQSKKGQIWIPQTQTEIFKWPVAITKESLLIFLFTGCCTSTETAPS